MEIIGFFLYLLFTSFSGLAVFELVGVKKIKIEFLPRLVIGYFLGLGLITWWMMILNYFALFELWKIVLPWMIIIFLWVILKSPKERFRFPKVSFFKVSIFIAIFIAFQLIFMSFQALSRDSLAFDAINNWVFKGKVFFLEKGLSRFFFTNDIYLNANVFNVYHRNQLHYLVDYPNLVHLSISFLFFVLGKVNLYLVKLNWVFIYLGLLLIFNFFLKKTGCRKPAIFLLLLTTVPMFYEETVGKFGPYADIVLAVFVFLGVIFLRFDEYFWGILFLSFGAWTKNEGLIPLLLGIVWLIRQRKFSYLLLPLIINLPWWLFVKINNIPSSSLYFENFDSLSALINKIWFVFVSFLKQILDVSLFNLVWIYWGLFLLWQRRNLKKLFLLLYFILGSIFIIFIFHIFTPNDSYNMTRLIFAYVPLTIFSLAYERRFLRKLA